MNMTEKEKDTTLKNFIRTNFPFSKLVKAGFFTKEMKGDYKAQAERVCQFFGYKTVYEYGVNELVLHISQNPPTDNFITIIPSYYE